MRKGGIRTVKVKSPKSRLVLGLKTVMVEPAMVKPSGLRKPRKPK